jgi:glycine/serine hydroxymethyltransferase
MKKVAELMHAVLAEKKEVRAEVKKLCAQFPLPYK